MKNNLRLLAVLFAVSIAVSCKKTDLNSIPVNSSSTDDDYVETSLPVQKSVTNNINSNIGGYLEALPAHYADHPDKHYPLIIFLHGQSELGNGSTSDLDKLANGGAIPKLINNKTFPENFIVNDKYFQFIVISPQFKAWPQASDINDMITYATQKYRIKDTRIYMCGLSMGGGGAWDYAWNYGSRISAVVPISGASWPTTQKGQNIADDSLAVWAFHNNDDQTVPSWYSIDYVQYINSYNPSIKAKLTLWPTGGHNAWTKATDPTYRENGKDIYEWMLSYSKPKK